MSKKFHNIVASVLSVALAFPVFMQADHNTNVNGSDIDFIQEDFNNDFYFQANEFLTLDEQALSEMADSGIELVDETEILANQIIDYAAQYLGRPYKHGAKGPSRFDCSGFTSYVFKEYGIELSPSSRTQALQGEEISTDQVRPGDLLFFGGRAAGKTVGHVALAVDVDNEGVITFIHASTRKGITYDRSDDAYYKKRYLGARRVIE